MATISPTPTTSGNGAFGVSINVTGAACVGTVTGDWVKLDGYFADGFAVLYDEDGGTGMSAASLTLDVLVGNDASTAYKVNNQAITATTFAITTDLSNPYFNLWPVSAAQGALIGAGISAIRAVAVITGTGAGADALKVTFCARRP